MPGVQIRTAEPDEWKQARDLRLEMLADTPEAYLEPLEEARALADEDWQARLGNQLAVPDRSITVVAVDASGRWRGQMVTMLDTFSGPPRMWLGAVFLSPQLRGSGAAAGMLRQIEQWTRERSHDQLWLEVHELNARAIGFYRRHGFVETGKRRPYPLDRSHDEVEMVKALQED